MEGRALNESNANAGLTAFLALARLGGKETQPDLLKALASGRSTRSARNRARKLRVIRSQHRAAGPTV